MERINYSIGSDSTFDSDDKLDRSGFCSQLEQFLLIESGFVDGSLVVALDAGFGSGKTTFIRMWQNSLLQRRGNGGDQPMPVVLNAWESDHCGDPLMAILAGLLNAVTNWKGGNKPDEKRMREAAKDVLWFTVGMANQVVAKISGIDSIKAGEFAQAKRDGPVVDKADYIKVYEERVGALKSLKDLLVESFAGHLPKIIIFVDELDRCRPDYAVSYLETIKHVFDTDGMVFVLAVDLPHLECSTKALFGSGIDFDEYFRKFCHRIFRLPDPEETSLLLLSRFYIERYLNVQGKRLCMINQQNFVERIVELSQAFKVRPRQMQEIFRIMGHATQTLDDKKHGQIFFGIGISTLLLSLIRVVRGNCFYKLLSNCVQNSGLCEEIIKNLPIEKAEWWIKMVLSGSRRDFPNEAELYHYLKSIRLPADERAYQYLEGFERFWGQRSVEFRSIARKIEEAGSFG